MIYPRWYQAEAVDALFNYFVANHGNPVEALPCGTGKSIVIGGFLYRVFSQYPRQRIMILTHVKELIRQDYDAVKAVWKDAPAGVYSAGLNRHDIDHPITFGGVASVIKVINDFGHIDLLIIDEAHLLGPSDDARYMQIIMALKAKNPFLKIIGFTATPYRQGMGLLTNGEIFTDIAYDLCTPQGYARLFAENFLVPPNQKACKVELNTAGLRIVNGDYSTNQLNEITREERITWEALNESLNKAPDRTCRLVFCTGIDHAILAADMCKHLGLRAAAVHSKMSAMDRDDIHAAYKNGELDVLTNNGIYTTGHDNPRIDHIIELRPTASVGLRVQMIGRGMRPFEENGWRKADCLVSDHCGNTRNLGPIDDPYIPKMKGNGAGDAPVKICPACDSYNHASARVCAHCGQPFELRIGYKREAWEDDAIIKSDLPIIERYDVQTVFYTRYTRKDATVDTKPVIKATYQCGLQRFVEFVAIEAMGFAQKKARDWWRQRFAPAPHQWTEADAQMRVPETVDEAMTKIDMLAPPKAINVWVNKKYPEIMGYEF